MNDWTTIFETGQLYLAEMVKGMLEGNNLEAVILNQQDSSYKFGTIAVMVKNEDKEKAEEIIKSANCE